MQAESTCPLCGAVMRPTCAHCVACRVLASRLSPEERFWRRVDRTQDCWLWLAALDKDGYGKVGGNIGNAHRYAWKLSRGPIPRGLTIDHTCRNRRCVNVAHMELVTIEENKRRGQAFRKALVDAGVLPFTYRYRSSDRCKYGHEYTPENTFVKERGGRSCKACIPRRNALKRRQARMRSAS